MNKIIMAMLVLLSTNLSLCAQVNELEDNKNLGFYGGFLGGANFQHFENPDNKSVKIDADLGYIFGGFIGYKFCNNLRLAGEFTYANNNLNIRRTWDSVSFFKSVDRNLSFVTNVYYDFDLGTRWTPYIGFGFGYSRSDYNRRRESHLIYDNVVCNSIAGVAYQIHSNMDLGLEYRCQFTQEKSYNHSLVITTKHFF